jgi:transposase-like protein
MENPQQQVGYAGFMIMYYLKLIDTIGAVAISYLVFHNPFTTWLLKITFEELPRELEEAALIDGATKTAALVRVILPNSIPMIASASILTFVLTWDEFLMAFILTSRIASRHIEAGSRIYTDSFPSYNVLQGMGYRHEYVNHSMGEYARGEVHINNCENRASLLRPWLSVHRGVSKDNLDTYLSLFQLQRNTNKPPTIEKIKTIVKI